jgi:hypothetical protein
MITRPVAKLTKIQQRDWKRVVCRIMHLDRQHLRDPVVASYDYGLRGMKEWYSIQAGSGVSWPKQPHPLHPTGPTD